MLADKVEFARIARILTERGYTPEYIKEHLARLRAMILRAEIKMNERMELELNEGAEGEEENTTLFISSVPELWTDDTCDNPKYMTNLR